MISRKNIVILIFMMAFTSISYAQPDFGGNNGDLTPEDNPAPISGLVALGIGVGVLIGYKKLNR